MPLRLRPTAPIAADAVLVGDPGRALLLAQELLEQPKMSNHARGLWGYSGQTPAGRELSIQATGMGGPSAALVLADLAELGVRRAIRVGTCTALDPELALGELLRVTEAQAWNSRGEHDGDPVLPDSDLTARLDRELGPRTRPAKVASLDALHVGGEAPAAGGAEAVDMQSASLLDRGRGLGVAVAAVLIVSRAAWGAELDDGALESAAKLAGSTAAAALSA